MTLEEKFQKLKDKWAEETINMSNMSDIYGNKYYQKIIKLGKEVVPLIFKELEKKYNHWFEALRQILRESPEIPEKSRGKIQEVTDIWLNYAKKNNLLESK